MNYRWVGFLLLPWGVVCAADEPYAFKELRIGMSLEQMKAQRTGLDCKKTNNPIGDIVCTSLSPNDTIAGVQLKSIMVGFHNDVLTSVLLTFDSRSFRTVTSALSEKYGTPTSEKTDIVQNRAGATFDNRNVVWKNASGELTASERFSKITDSSVQLFSADYRRFFMDRKAADQKGRAKDL
jgi:hypothetical protein